MASQPILVATDLSEPSDEGLRQASEWARLRQAELIVCHVAPSLLRSNMLFPQAAAQQVAEQPMIESRIGDAVQERTSAVTGRGPDDFRVVITSGTAYAEIVRQSEELGAGLIVVGSHGRSGLSTVFLGNNAESIVRHASVSVLLARPHKKSGHIAVATDFSDGAFAALVAAAEQARLANGRITLLCSVREKMESVVAMSEFGAVHGFVQDEYKELCKNAERDLHGLLDRARIAGDVFVTDGNPATALLQLAADRDADLVVIGATGRTALKRMQLGRVAERVTRHAPCSVLVVRAPTKK
jgi:nucleotide-binding universal stress UspA family protein